MNKERLLELADTIEQDNIKDLKFSMEIEFEQIENGGNKGCFMGWAAYLYTDDPDPNANTENFAQLMDISIKDALAICWFDGVEQAISGLKWDSVSNKQAATMLRKYVETNRIDWNSVLTRDNYEV